MKAGRLLLGLLCLALLLWRLPAHVAAYLLDAACAGQCRLAATEGTLWRGQGQLYLAGGQDNWYALGRLSWQLPAGDALARARLENGSLVWLAYNRVEVSDIALPAAAVLAQPALDLPVGNWQGSLLIRHAKAQWAPTSQHPASSGEVLWLGAASGLLGDRPLGDYRLTWNDDGGSAPDIRIAGGRPGEIGIDGQLEQSRLLASVELKAAAQNELGRYLTLAPGVTDAGNGRYTVDYRLR